MAGTSDREGRLDNLLGAYFEAIERGETIGRATLLAEHPEFVAELSAFFDEQDRLHRLASPFRTDEGDYPETRVPLDIPTVAPDSFAGLPIAGELVRYVGDYQLLGEIARGGMGVVFRARQISLNRPVALKMILSGAMAGDEEKRRFAIEAEAVAGLDHPNIAPVHEVGQHDGHPYFSMKLIEGGSLASRAGEFLKDPARAARVLIAIADAIGHAHRRGILHRDLKPSNVLLDPDGTPYVVDFGLARKTSGNPELTQTGAILGTPAYMPPEQALGRKDAATTAADVYGLGAILYALLAGRPPFPSGTTHDTLERVKTQIPDRPSAIHPSVPRDLETICLKCLEKEPTRRYASAEALAQDLRRWRDGEPIEARPVSRPERFRMWCKRNPVVATLSGSLVLFLIAASIISALAARSYRNLASKEHTTAGKEREATAKAIGAEKVASRNADEARHNLYIAHMNLARAAWEAGEIPRVRDLLDMDRNPTPGHPDPRSWEWYYLDRLANEGVVILGKHEGIRDRNYPFLRDNNGNGLKRGTSVTSLAFSPDGSMLASAGSELRAIAP